MLCKVEKMPPKDKFNPVQKCTCCGNKITTSVTNMYSHICVGGVRVWSSSLLNQERAGKKSEKRWLADEAKKLIDEIQIDKLPDIKDIINQLKKLVEE